MNQENQSLILPEMIRPKVLPGDEIRRRLLRLCGGERKHAVMVLRHRAVIFSDQRLGDLLLASPVIAQLLQHFGEAETLLAISPEESPLAEELFPRVSKVMVPLSLAWGGWRLTDAVRLRHELAVHACEHLVCLRHHRSPLAQAVLGWIPARERWGVVGHPWLSPPAVRFEEGVFTRTVRYRYSPGEDGIPAEVQAHADLLALVTGRAQSARELLPRFVARTRPDDTRLRLVIAPWGSSRIKALPEGVLATILRGLSERTSLAVTVVAAPTEQRVTEALVERLRHAVPALEITALATPTLRDLRTALAEANAVLCADSFPGHLATALDRPAAILATGAMPGVFGPWGRLERQRWFGQQTPCRGCGWRCPYPQPPCLYEIAPAPVIEFLGQHLTADYRT